MKSPWELPCEVQPRHINIPGHNHSPGTLRTSESSGTDSTSKDTGVPQARFPTMIRTWEESRLEPLLSRDVLELLEMCYYLEFALGTLVAPCADSPGARTQGQGWTGSLVRYFLRPRAQATTVRRSISMKFGVVSFPLCRKRYKKSIMVRSFKMWGKSSICTDRLGLYSHVCNCISVFGYSIYIHMCVLMSI